MDTGQRYESHNAEPRLLLASVLLMTVSQRSGSVLTRQRQARFRPFEGGLERMHMQVQMPPAHRRIAFVQRITVKCTAVGADDWRLDTGFRSSPGCLLRASKWGKCRGLTEKHCRDGACAGRWLIDGPTDGRGVQWKTSGSRESWKRFHIGHSSTAHALATPNLMELPV